MRPKLSKVCEHVKCKHYVPINNNISYLVGKHCEITDFVGDVSIDTYLKPGRTNWRESMLKCPYFEKLTVLSDLIEL